METHSIPFALDEAGNRVLARYATKYANYNCADCKDKCLLKKGNVRIAHFSHYPNAIVKCNFFTNNSKESLAHLTTKLFVRDNINKLSFTVPCKYCPGRVTIFDTRGKEYTAKEEFTMTIHENKYRFDVCVFENSIPIGVIEVVQTHRSSVSKFKTLKKSFGDNYVEIKTLDVTCADEVITIPCEGEGERICQTCLTKNCDNCKEPVGIANLNYIDGKRLCVKCVRQCGCCCRSRENILFTINPEICDSCWRLCSGCFKKQPRNTFDNFNEDFCRECVRQCSFCNKKLFRGRGNGKVVDGKTYCKDHVCGGCKVLSKTPWCDACQPRCCVCKILLSDNDHYVSVDSGYACSKHYFECANCGEIATTKNNKRYKLCKKCLCVKCKYNRIDSDKSMLCRECVNKVLMDKIFRLRIKNLLKYSKQYLLKYDVPRYYVTQEFFIGMFVGDKTQQQAFSITQVGNYDRFTGDKHLLLDLLRAGKFVPSLILPADIDKVNMFLKNLIDPDLVIRELNIEGYK